MRVIQDREYEPLGSEQTQRTTARVIAATHRDLEQMIEDGTFREDLYTGSVSGRLSSRRSANGGTTCHCRLRT